MADLALVPEGAGATGAQFPQAVLVVDDRRRVVEANESACRLIGRDREKAVGKSLDVLLEPAMRERIRHVWKAFAEGGGHAGPFTLANGVDVQVSMAPNLMADRHLLVLSPVAPTETLPGPDDVELEQPSKAASAQGARPSRRGPSPRELEILGLLAEGATDPQIAKQLGLSPATVQTHVRNAKAKLGAKTRAQAVAMSLGLGLIRR